MFACAIPARNRKLARATVHLLPSNIVKLQSKHHNVEAKSRVLKPYGVELRYRWSRFSMASTKCLVNSSYSLQPRLELGLQATELEVTQIASKNSTNSYYGI